MSWSSRLSRFSPFGRSSSSSSNPASTTVADSDFSYITPSDLDAHHLSRSARDTDVLVFRHKKVSYPTHFPAHSIDDGKLTIGAARDAAAKKLVDAAGGGDGGSLDPRRVRMFWKGRNLKDDAKSVREEGLSSDAQAEILCVIGEVVVSSSSSSAAAAPPLSSAEAEEDDAESDNSDGDGTSTPGGSAAPKRKRNRNRKKKKGGKGASGAGTGTSTPVGALPEGGVALPQTPLTPMAKLVAIADHFRATLQPACEAYVTSPPAEKAKREFEHKRLTETTFQQCLLKLDGVETEGLEEVRLKRKELVREIQGWLNKMDDTVKSYA